MLLQAYRGGRLSALRPDGAGRPHDRLHLLTVGEREVLTQPAQGRSTQEVASSLRVSVATIKSHVSHSLTRLGVRNRLEAVLLLHEA